MPLLCISLLALLLLPLSLSCDNRKPLKELSQHYMVVLQTEINNITGSILTLLQNPSCSELKHKLPNCTPGVDVASTLLNLACKMKYLKLSETNGLVRDVLNSLGCPCLDKPRPTTRRPRAETRRNEQKKKERERKKKLCKVKAILSTMTECYIMLNAIAST